MTALQDLLAGVEAAWVSTDMIIAAFDSPLVHIYALGAFDGYLDAAKALHDTVLPGWDLQICTYEDDLFEVSVSLPLCVKTYDGLSEIIARAWLIAVLRALIAQEEGK